MAKKNLNKKSATEIYFQYKDMIKKKGLKRVWEDENGEVHTKYVAFDSKKMAQLKDFVKVYENVEKGIGLDGHSLEDSYEFARQAIDEEGWETEYGNIRKVSRKMKYLVFIYEDLINHKAPEPTIYEVDDYDIMDTDARPIGRTMAVMPHKSRW